MSNSDFSKEEQVAFENLLEGFEDYLVLSSAVSVFRGGGSDAQAERSDDVIWRPMPHIAVSYDGRDQTANFKGSTQLSVPSSVGFEKSVPWVMSATELRDALAEGRLKDSAHQRLASDINVALMNVAANYGTIFVKRSTAASGYDDLAECEAAFNEVGIASGDRYAALSTRDYNKMASNLAGRQTMGDMPSRAYRESYVGRVASFETFKLDYANRKAAAAGGGSLTIDTRASASNYWVPKATRVASTGEKSNVDNRFQTITVSSTTNVADGDSFTIAGVNACHHITKGDTGQLKTFRVIEVLNGTTMVISPAIISAQGGSKAELEYQNCIVTESATAAITFLNTVAGYVNPFWHKDAIELRPSRYAIPADAGAAVMRASTSQGIEVTLMKQFDIKTLETFFRADIRFGAYMVQPEMSGLMMFNQT